MDFEIITGNINFHGFPKYLLTSLPILHTERNPNMLKIQRSILSTLFLYHLSAIKPKCGSKAEMEIEG